MAEEKSYIELNTFLKIKGFAGSGGEAKQLIRSEQVQVNDEIETRNKRKLFGGEKIVISGKTVVVDENEIL